MSINTPNQTPPARTNTLMLILSAAVALVVIIALVVLVAIGKASWQEVGPLIGVLAGVHGGASLTAFNPLG